MKYYQHKENKTVIFELLGENEFLGWLNGKARFTKWKWKNGCCSEEFIYKDLTSLESFDEITMEEYNNQWGVNLQNA